jgi:cytochrome c oxidase subunit 4
MSDSHAHDAGKHVKLYFAVFAGLAVLTAVTVYVAGLKHTVMAGVAIALIIAVIKGSMVASFFMHLVNEKKGIFWLLALTALFFAALIFLPLGALLDQQGKPLHSEPQQEVSHHVP